MSKGDEGEQLEQGEPGKLERLSLSCSAHENGSSRKLVARPILADIWRRLPRQILPLSPTDDLLVRPLLTHLRNRQRIDIIAQDRKISPRIYRLCR